MRDENPHEGLLHLPGGRVLFQETINQAAKRLVKTEVGIGISITKTLGTIEFLHEIRNKKKFHSVSVVVLARPDKKIPYEGKFYKKIPKNICPDQKRFLKEKNIYD